MQIVQWNPFRELENSLFGLRKEPSTWLPAVDIKETEDSYTIYVELPGLTKDAIRVAVSDNTLSVAAERNSQEENKEDNFHIVERRYGKFERRFSLPHNAATDQIKADYTTGVLNLVIPKREDTIKGATEIAVS